MRAVQGKTEIGQGKFPLVLEYILKALDPSIQKVEPSNEADDADVIRRFKMNL